MLDTDGFQLTEGQTACGNFSKLLSKIKKDMGEPDILYKKWVSEGLTEINEHMFKAIYHFIQENTQK